MISAVFISSLPDIMISSKHRDVWERRRREGKGGREGEKGREEKEVGEWKKHKIRERERRYGRNGDKKKR